MVWKSKEPWLPRYDGCKHASYCDLIHEGPTEKRLNCNGCRKHPGYKQAKAKLREEKRKHRITWKTLRDAWKDADRIEKAQVICLALLLAVLLLKLILGFTLGWD